MGDKTNIEWADATWNPIVGCSITSPGCTNCYAMQWANQRLDGNEKSPHYAGTTKKVNGNAVWTGKVVLAPDHIIKAPVHWRKPRRIFVNSMGDLFHEAVPDEWIDKVFHIMAICPWHTFLVLTKRSRRMREYLSNPVVQEEFPGLPLPNVWLGVSTEDQARADERIPDLLATPSAVRFVSAEPLLGRIDFEDLQGVDALCGFAPDPDGDQHKLDWIIVGGESGKNARPMHPDWARSIRDQCAEAGVPFFFKQWGEWRPDSLLFTDTKGRCPPPNYKEGKRRTGRLLDGVTHDGMPEGDTI